MIKLMKGGIGPFAKRQGTEIVQGLAHEKQSDSFAFGEADRRE
jgi:hypothetical protein